jgi:hypothetical protein
MSSTTTSLVFNYEATMYFVSNNTPDNLTYLSEAKTNSKKFKELAITIFGDCPDLMEKNKC